MKKILFVSHEKYKNGATNSMVTLVKELMDMYNYDIEVLIPADGPAKKLLWENNIKHKIFYYFDNRRVIGKRKPCRELFKEIINQIAVIRLIYKLKKSDYDYVVSNSSAVDIGARAAAKLSKKHVYYIREFMEEDFSFEYRNKKRMKYLLEISNKVIFISYAVSNKYISLYRLQNYRIIYNGVEAKNYYINEHEILNKKALNFIQIGRLCEGKGTKASVHLIAKISETVECHLTLVGDGSSEYIKELKEYVEKNKLNQNVSIVPYEGSIMYLLCKSDILLMNSKSEGFGRVTVEGMLGGLLVIGKDSGGTSEVIQNGKTGMLFSNEIEFSKIIQDVYVNPLKYKKIAVNGQEYALERFSKSKNAQEVHSYLREQ